MNGMRLMRLVLYLVAMLMLASCVAPRGEFPAWMYPNPPRVSTEADPSDSDMPAIYTDGGDNVIVAWSSDPTDLGHGDTEVWWRRYNVMGTPQTPPVRLTYNAYGDYYPAIGMNDGVTYLVWMGDETISSNIYWGAVDQNGNFVAGPQVISDQASESNDYDPHIIQCGNYSHVFWSGHSASNDYEIYYAKIRYSGIVDISYKSLTNLLKPEHSPHGAANLFCTRLFIAYEYDKTFTDTDVYLVGVNTDNGNVTFGPTILANTTFDEKDIDMAVNSTFAGGTLISVVWNRDDGAGGEIFYASRNPDGSPCDLVTALTNDSQLDARPVVANAEYDSKKYAFVFWERVEPGTGTDRDIYATFFNDNCAPSPPTTPMLISESTASADAEDVYPQVQERSAPTGEPIFAVLWRTQGDGAVWSRFGSIGYLIGASELISDSTSAGFPTGADRPAAVAIVRNQLYVTWVGSNLGTFETWYQQTAWRSSLPIIVK